MTYFPNCQTLRGMDRLEPKEAASLLLRGGIMIYPTETFYAIGCLASNVEAAVAIFQIKGRPRGKPMPLLAGSLAQAGMVVDLDAAPAELYEEFWPGPLSILLAARPTVPPALANARGKTAIRVSSSPEASSLAQLCGYPLTASSANFSGMPPAANQSDLDWDFLEAARQAAPCGLMARRSFSPQNSRPSTLLEPVRTKRGWVLKILRQGAIDRQTLRQKNFILA